MKKTIGKNRTVIAVLVAAAALILPVFVVSAAGDNITGNLRPLNTVQVPLPSNLNDFIVDRAAAIRLGKALFWDQQAGSDGVQACATCHFQAGADVRNLNALNPGADHVFNTAPAGAQLLPSHFPIATGDIVGSQGVIDTNFNALSGFPSEDCTTITDPLFTSGGVNVRQVTGRNAPFAVNAIYYYRAFWDGRANNSFNGVNPSGPSDDTIQVYEVINGQLAWVNVAIPNASLASQAVGPPGSPVEMACAGRLFPQIGRKLLGLQPLSLQLVHPTDSVLGGLSRAPQNGLNTSYESLIKQAFDPKWWNHSGTVNGYTMMEQNFSLYWGLSILLYESTLVSDNTRVDQFLAGNSGALTVNEQQGMKIYTGKGRCDKCHGGAELTEASVSQAGGDPKAGFFNTAVRPVIEDGGDIFQPGQAKFKTPSLRNIELTGPYFHNGNKSTLWQVVDFYDRGGDFPNQFTDSDVRALGLTDAQKRNLIAFMLALTDERVRYERAPFDHPSLNIPNFGTLPAVGASGRSTAVQPFLGLSPYQH